MKERGLMFKGPLVRAIQSGWKTQTRRPLYVLGKVRRNSAIRSDYPPPQEHMTAAGFPNVPVDKCWQLSPLAKVMVGDRFYVKEAWRPIHAEGDPSQRVIEYDYRATYKVGYRLGDNLGGPGNGVKWKSSMFMPRAAARLVLEVTDVRIQRLHDISERDAGAEGCEMWDHAHNVPLDPDRRTYGASFRLGFQRLWESINGEEDWAANNWVLAFTFRKVL